jgi:hypothetical protein
MPKGSGFYCIVGCVVREGVGLKFGVKIANFQKFEENAGEAWESEGSRCPLLYTQVPLLHSHTLPVKEISRTFRNLPPLLI